MTCSSQSTFDLYKMPSDDEVEIIDLTDEPVLKADTTITINDSVVECLSDGSDRSQTPPIVLDPFSPPPHPSPLEPIGILDDSKSDSSSVFSRPGTPQSLFCPSPKSPLSSPRPKLSQQPTPSAKLTKSASKRLKKQERELAKQERENAKQEKLREKEEQKLVREANRANAANKALDNCTAKIDRGIIDIINDAQEITLRTLFDESMVKYQLTDYSLVENSISWVYKHVDIIDGSCVPSYKHSNWVIIVMKGSDYFKKMQAYKAKSDDENSIKTFLDDVRSRTKSDIILVVYDLSNYLRTERMKDARNFRKTFKDRFEGTGQGTSTGVQAQSSESGQTIGVTELQDLRLMFEMECKSRHPKWKLHIEFYERTNDVIQAFVRYTLSIARYQVKHRAQTSTGLDWAISMDKEKAVDPTKSSEDLTKLWITQLQQFSQVTLPIAKAIAAEYPSPFALLDQYQSLTTKEAEELLSELYVQRNLRRQIGPSISKRIHCFMTCEDPSVHIGLS